MLSLSRTCGFEFISQAREILNSIAQTQDFLKFSFFKTMAMFWKHDRNEIRNRVIRIFTGKTQLQWVLSNIWEINSLVFGDSYTTTKVSNMYQHRWHGYVFGQYRRCVSKNLWGGPKIYLQNEVYRSCVLILSCNEVRLPSLTSRIHVYGKKKPFNPWISVPK